MAKYKIYIKPSAVKELERVPSKKDCQKIVSRIQALADEPRSAGSKKLVGQERYRMRQGWYRVIYEINDFEIVIYVVKIDHRKNVYQ